MESKNVWLSVWEKLLSGLWSKRLGVKDGVKLLSAVSLDVDPVAVKTLQKSEKNESTKTKLLTESVETFLKSRYDFRYNVLTEETEFRSLERMDEGFSSVNQRVLNTLCLEAHEEGISCWDRDLSRCIYSTRITEYHPFKLYLDELSVWDGMDRLTGLAQRVSKNPLWVKDFHIWMRGMTAQWLGVTGVHAYLIRVLG